MRQKIGSLYAGIRVTNAVQYSYSSIFLLRRFIYAIVTAAFLEDPLMCVYVFQFCNYIYVIYIILASVHESKLALRVEYLNEMGL